ncbi:MAG TPA: hypothetical protein VFY20_08285 [Gemmatimonadales bacterium]|nr:hypothetical protein [Gemmatimonadales bacterium]
MQLAVCILVALSTACGADSSSGGPTPPPVASTDTLSIVSISPADGTVDLLWPTVQVQADVPLEPIPLVLGAVTLSENGVALTPVFTLVGDRRTFSMDVAMLPGQEYVLELTTSLQGTGGEKLATAQSVTFATRAPRVADIVPASASLRQWIALDAEGGRHVLSIDASAGTVTYGTCRTADCGSAGAWASAVVESVPLSALATGSIAVDAQGRVHVTYPILATTTLRYATCAGSCEAAANWTRADVDTSANPGLWSAIRSDAAGRLHVVYSDWGDGGLRYATCAVTCATTADWASVALPVPLQGVQDVDLAVAGSGTLSVILRGQGTAHSIVVAECVAVCLSTAAWQVGTLLESAQPSGGTAIAVDVDGVRHAAFQAASTQLVYATCQRECGEAGQWQRVTLPVTTAGHSPGIATARGRLALVAGSSLLATCRAACTAASNWRAKSLGGASTTWNHPRVAMSTSGQPLIVTGRGGAQYLE